MSERNFAFDDAGLDDLPRTLRREREARSRATLDQAPPVSERDRVSPPRWDHEVEPVPSIVRAIEVPFFRLVLFFLKAAVAAIPALILLTAILFAGGQILKNVFPNLRHFEIEIRPVGSAFDPAPTAPRPVIQRK